MCNAIKDTEPPMRFGQRNGVGGVDELSLRGGLLNKLLIDVN